MPKRLPFGSRDPNVRPVDPVDLESIGSSIPSIQEALRNEGKKRKKTKTSFSSSKTPRISNRSKPPMHDVGSNTGTLGSKHLRKLKQSMVNRQQPEATPGNVSSMATKQTDGAATSVKRKGHSDEDVAEKKRIKVSHVDVEHIDVEEAVTERMSAASAAQGETQVATSDNSVSVISKRKREVETVTIRRQGRNVAAEYLHNHRNSTKEMAYPELLTAHEESAQHQPARSERPVGPKEHFEGHTTDEAMMDCSSDEASLSLSPTPDSSPSKEKVEHDKAWVLIPPVQLHARIPVVEKEETELRHDFQRHSMTTLFADSRRSPRLDKNDIQKQPRAKSDSHSGPIVTKDMLARARKAKPDNKAAVDAMLNSGPAYKGTHARTFSPDISVVGKMIDTLEGSESLCGSEVTMLSAESLHLQRRLHKNTKHETTPHIRGRSHETKSVDVIRRRVATSEGARNRHDEKSEDTSKRLDAESDTSMRHRTKSKDTSRRCVEKPEDTREDSQSGSANESNRQSSIELDISARSSVPFSRREREPNIRQPESGGVHVEYQVGFYNHNSDKMSVMIPHPQLPPGWVIRISKSKQQIFYSHPEDGTKWYCPVVMSQHSTEMITRFLSQFFGHTTEAPSTDQETESESSETCYTLPPSNDQEDYASENGSQTSLTSASSAGRSHDRVHSVAKSEIVDAEGESGSERSPSTQPEVGVNSPMTDDDELEATVGLSRSDSLTATSPEISARTGRSQDHTHDIARRVTLDATCLSGPELSPSSTVLANYEVTDEEEVVTDEVEELVSTVRFRRSESGTVIASHEIDFGEGIKGTYGDDYTAIVPGNNKILQVEPNAEYAFAQDDEVDVDMHNTSVAESAEDEKLATEVGGATSSLNRGDDGMMPTLQSVNVSGFTEAESMEVDQDEQAMYDEDAAGHAKGEGFEAEIDNVVFGHDHDDVDLSPHVKRPSSIQDRTTDGGNEKQDEAFAYILASEHGGPNEPKEGDDGASNEVAVGQSRHGGFETKIDNLSPIQHSDSFDNGSESLLSTGDEAVADIRASELGGPNEPKEGDHGASNQVAVGQSRHGGFETKIDNLSPIHHSDSFDNGSESLLSAGDRTKTESEDESVFDKPLDASPSRKNSVEHNTLDHHDQQDDNLSIASSLTGTTTRGDSRASKWRGFSQRVLHPPCPLCSLVRIEELFKAAIAKMKQRKAKASRKSFRKKKRDVATRLVFA